MGKKKETIFQEQTARIKDLFLDELSQNEVLKKRGIEEDGQRIRPEGEYNRDYTRILYASSFRRLQGKMQLYAVQSDQFIRNRLTHSLEVAQIARSIASEIGYNSEELYVVEAGALAHDLGNPPFGHAGERHLNKLCAKIGGFEGNAQTLRILTTVEQKRPDFQGLNLTNRVLLSVVKYFNKFDNTLSIDSQKYSKQKFIYDDDYELIEAIRENAHINQRTLDVQIVDLADEIAYAAHDLEDGLRLRVFTVDELLHDLGRVANNNDVVQQFEDIICECKEKSAFKNANISSSDFSKLYRKELSSKLINTLIQDIGIVKLSEKEKNQRGTKAEQEIGFVTYKSFADGLKKTIYECTTNSDGVYAYEKKGEEMLTELAQFYNKNVLYLPPEYRAENIIKQYSAKYSKISGDDKRVLQNRLIIDYISGMMDEYVNTTYHRLLKDE